MNLAQRAEYLNALLSSQSTQLATCQAASQEPLTSIPSVGVSLGMSPNVAFRGEGAPHFPVVAPVPSPFATRNQQLTISGERRMGPSHSGSSRSSSAHPHGQYTPSLHDSDTGRMNSFLSGEQPVRT